MLLIAVVYEIGIQVELSDVKIQLEGIYLVCIAVYSVVVFIHSANKCSAQFLVEIEFPLHSEIHIAVSISRIGIQLKLVVAEVAGEVEIVRAVDTMADAEVDILE